MKSPISRRLRLAGLLPAALGLGQAAALAAHQRAAFALPIDDAYIFLRYAENLAAGHGFSFNPGETSFGCTSLIWPFILAAGRLLSAPPEWFSFWTGAGLYAAGLWLAAVVAGRASGRVSVALGAGLTLALSSGLFMNAVSGMETPLTFFLLMLYAALALGPRPRPGALGLLAAALTLNRPESLYFGPVAAVLALAVMARYRRVDPGWLGRFLLPWLLLCLPAALLIHARTGYWLPTTFMGKMLSASPELLQRGLLTRAGWALLSLGDGWHKLLQPYGLLAPLVVIGIAVEAAAALYLVRRRREPAAGNFGRLLLFGYLFLPASYGFSFPVHPAFGGYYFRYIAPVEAAGVLLAGLGLLRLAGFLAARLSVPEKRRPVAAIIVVGLLVAARAGMWTGQAAEARATFAAEARLNSFRKQAAEWLRANTPPDARVMVGYTGLGVVGGGSGRYCLDLGALINPDIFPYYRRAGNAPARRNAALLQYMRDRRAGWYVTFALPPGSAALLFDPAADPHFHEAARLPPGEPAGPYRQLRIYRIAP